MKTISALLVLAAIFLSGCGIQTPSDRQEQTNERLERIHMDLQQIHRDLQGRMP